MLTPVAQRWRDRRGTYRPAGEVIDTRLYEVASSQATSVLHARFARLQRGPRDALPARCWPSRRCGGAHA